MARMRTHSRLAAGMAFVALLCGPSVASGQSLGAAKDFAILGGSAVTAASGSSKSQIAGDVGVSPGTSITGFPSNAEVTGSFTLHNTPTDDAASQSAQSAVTALFTSLSTDGGSATTIPNQLAGQHLGPGTYSLGAANLASGGTLYLTGSGTYIFRVSSSLTTISTSNVSLGSGAEACNIWWQVGSSATIGGTTFSGNVIAATGTNSLGPDAILTGRLLSETAGAVTMSGNNQVTAAYCAAVPPPGNVGITKAFSPNANGVNGVSTLTATLTNNNASAATLSSALVDSLPSGLVLASSPNASTTCGGGVVTATAGGTSITLSSGSTIPGGSPGSCKVIANVTSSTAATYTNTVATGALQTDKGNNTVAAVATLVISSSITPVPTLPEWALIVLAAFLLLSGFFAIRRRRLTH
jgi:Ice-binding-like/IPTL-CTERM motif